MSRNGEDGKPAVSRLRRDKFQRRLQLLSTKRVRGRRGGRVNKARRMSEWGKQDTFRRDARVAQTES